METYTVDVIKQTEFASVCVLLLIHYWSSWITEIDFLVFIASLFNQVEAKLFDQ